MTPRPPGVALPSHTRCERCGHATSPSAPRDVAAWLRKQLTRAADHVSDDRVDGYPVAYGRLAAACEVAIEDLGLLCRACARDGVHADAEAQP